MLFLIHKNFPFQAGELLRCWDIGSEFKRMDDDYPPHATPEEILELQAKQAKAFRPIVIGLDDGIRSNAVRADAMRQTRCNWVVFVDAWGSFDWEKLRTRLLVAWPRILKEFENMADHWPQFHIDVMKNAKVRRFDL